eukprot:gnl/TRDRNA2_/TRDRNA2_204783_c0_seq1.p1 gnl/TRDRNA2_/TRDRNA2_204783_c0~~gnl/TRDRNA2_/TRDRNA2_204783_c0_seq1.p1  ORF type:complete len:203 (-),score=13.50 gnl/TRDRNA2_/TRDRNA2_204783_c0_seq1:38-646(-)
MAEANDGKQPSVPQNVIVGQPVGVVEIGAVPGAAGQVSQEKPCTGLCCCGNTILGFEIWFLISGLFNMLLQLTVSDGGMDLRLLRMLRLLFVISLIAIIAALVFLCIERPIPRGCACIQACAVAQSGCCSCPCVPWFIGVTGVIGFLLTLLGLAEISSHEGEAGMIILGIVFVVVEILQSILGFTWLGLFQKQSGYCCCKTA